MEHENLIVEIEGNEAEDIYPSILNLEVELDNELASMFRMKLSILLDEEGTWSFIDDERLQPWKQVTIKAGFENTEDELISGYITHVRPYFDPDPSRCMLEIWGMDNSVMMDRQEKLKDWPNKKDSDIASEIFSLYGLTPDVEDTEVIHDEALSTIIQRESDMQFLKRLALRNGFECYVQGDTGYFKNLDLDSPPQPLLSVQFGEQTVVNRLSIEVNALTPVNVSMSQIDKVSKEVLEANIESSQQTSLGSRNAAGQLAAGMEPAGLRVNRNTATGTPEMTALCQGIYHKGEWFVTVQGEIAGNQYGHVLKARQNITIRGIGETYSGIYYVSSVTHLFSAEGYKQFFTGKRNALMPSGSEDFSSSAGMLAGML